MKLGREIISTQNVGKPGDDQSCWNMVWAAWCVTTLKVTRGVWGQASDNAQRWHSGHTLCFWQRVWENKAVRHNPTIPTSLLGASVRPPGRQQGKTKGQTLELNPSPTTFSWVTFAESCNLSEALCLYPELDFSHPARSGEIRGILHVECF